MKTILNYFGECTISLHTPFGRVVQTSNTEREAYQHKWMSELACSNNYYRTIMYINLRPFQQ